MKKSFLAGLAILLPIAITIMIVVFIVDFLTAPFTGFAQEIITSYGGEIAEEYEFLLDILSRIVVLVLLVALTWILGVLGRRLFFSWILKLTNRLLAKIPIVKNIYRIALDVTTNIISEEKKKLFKGTVSVPFPHAHSRALGLLSGSPPEELKQHLKNTELHSIFIPTAPHPISGFLLMYDEKEVKHVEIETEDVFKFLLSCGMFQPGKNDDSEEK